MFLLDIGLQAGSLGRREDHSRRRELYQLLGGFTFFKKIGTNQLVLGKKLKLKKKKNNNGT